MQECLWIQRKSTSSDASIAIEVFLDRNTSSRVTLDSIRGVVRSQVKGTVVTGLEEIQLEG